MEKKTETQPVKKNRGDRPPASESTKRAIELAVEGDYVLVKIPRKDLTKRLLSDILN